MLIICIAAFAAGLFCGYGLGRNGSACGADRRNNNISGSGFTETEEAVERAVAANAEAAATIQKMRDIVNRNRGIANDPLGRGETE